MKLTDQIEQDLKEALKAGDQAKLSALRMLKNNLNVAAKEAGQDLAEPEAVKIIQKEIKQRQESAESYRKGGRAELADKEEADITIYKAYLPAQLDEAELKAAVDKAIADTKASTLQDMGKVMGQLNQELAGKADMGQVSALVKDRLVSSNSE